MRWWSLSHSFITELRHVTLCVYIICIISISRHTILLLTYTPMVVTSTHASNPLLLQTSAYAQFPPELPRKRLRRCDKPSWEKICWQHNDSSCKKLCETWLSIAPRHISTLKYWERKEATVWRQLHICEGSRSVYLQASQRGCNVTSTTRKPHWYHPSFFPGHSSCHMGIARGIKNFEAFQVAQCHRLWDR